MPTARRALATSLVWRRGDRALMLAVGTLTAFGLVMVFSASEVQGWLWFHNAAYYFERQLLWLLLGVILLWAGAHIDYHRLRPLALPLGLLSVGLLVLVLLPHFGVEVNGARRWLRLGPLQMQPAELAKVAAIIFMALWLERHRARLSSLENGVVPFLALLGLVAVLIILERDLGTTLIVAAILLPQFLFALFTYRGYRVALKAPDAFGSLLACGVTTWVAFQALINIAAVTVTLPTTGIPLPFISYGGSSLAITLGAVGILVNVSTQNEKVGWIRHASVDLGRRNGRTLVPSDRRRAGAVAERT